jgi:hypothetical protein
LRKVLCSINDPVNRLVLLQFATTDTNFFREFLERSQLVPTINNIADSKFKDTLITKRAHENLVDRHFRNYPILFLDLKANILIIFTNFALKQFKNVQGNMYEMMLESFDALVHEALFERAALFRSNILSPECAQWYQKAQQSPVPDRASVFQMLSEALRLAYNRRVVVLIDEYDSPMHCAIECGYANSVWLIFSSLI